MWSFYERAGDWYVTNGTKTFTLAYREDAIELSGILNTYFLGALNDGKH